MLDLSHDSFGSVYNFCNASQSMPLRDARWYLPTNLLDCKLKVARDEIICVTAAMRDFERINMRIGRKDCKKTCD